LTRLIIIVKIISGENMTRFMGIARSVALGVVKTYSMERKAGNESETLLDDIIDEKMMGVRHLSPEETKELRREVKILALVSL
jgi:hypothetical protein